MNARGLYIVTFCAILLALLPWGTGFANPLDVPREPPTSSQESTQNPKDIPPAFRIVGLDDRPKLRDNVRLVAVKARTRIFENTELDWEGTALIVWADEKSFLEKTGFQPENTAAAASPSQKVIWINEANWIKVDERSRIETMTHEVGHLLLGSLPGGDGLPLWANEGIVMHLAGQWSYDEQMKLLAAHAADQLPQLADLEKEFPRTGESQSLAYRMSYSAIGVIADNYGDQPGEVRRLVRRLADPMYGPSLEREFWDAFRRDGWQLATERSLGSRFMTAVAVLTGTGSIFLLITILAVFAYFRLKVKNRGTEQRWSEDDDEPWAESLTDEDIQDIYGDREDRWEERS